MNTKLVCTFSSNDVEFPFTEGKVYDLKDNPRGFNRLTCHITSDNGNSVLVETSQALVNGNRVWVVKDPRTYSKYVNYASFQ